MTTNTTDQLTPGSHPPQMGDHTGVTGGQEASARAVRRGSAVAGAGLVLMIGFALVGNLMAVESLVTAGDAGRTADDILASTGLFRAGIASLAAVVALDVVVAWALYHVFAPVDAGLSRLAAAFRYVYAGVFLVAIGHLVSAVDLLTGAGMDGFETRQVEALALAEIEAFGDIWSAGLALFGVHLVLVGVLAWRSGYVPRWLGVLLIVAAGGYLFDSVAAILVGDAAPSIAMFTFLGEVLLAVWLLVRGRRLGSVGPRTGRGGSS